MISTSITTNPNAMATILVASKERLARVVVAYWKALLQAVGVPNPRPYKDSSKSGEPPRKRTGGGQKGIVFEIAPDGLSGRVGCTPAAIHMIHLELAKNPKRRREWLLVTLQKELPRLKQIAAGGK